MKKRENSEYDAKYNDMPMLPHPYICSHSPVSSTSSMTTPPLASVIPWEHVCRMLEKVQGAKRAKKKEMLLKFITPFRELHKKKLQHQPDCVSV